MQRPTNPLLQTDGLPRFDAIRAEHVRPAVEERLAEFRTWLEERLAEGSPYTWEDLVAPMERLDHRLDRTWSPVSHLNGVCSEPELRNAHNDCLVMLSDFETEMGQNEALYRAMGEVAESPELDAQQRALLEHALRDFRLAGVALPEASKDRFREIMRELSILSSRFEENVLDGTDAFSLHLTEASRLTGLPDHVLERARTRAAEEDLDGWLFGLDFPTYHAVISHAEDRELRRRFHEAWATRGSDQGPHDGAWDNGPLMDDILALRHESAELLGFADYTEYSLATKMARDPDEVLAFLEELAERARPYAEREFRELTDYAKEHGGPRELEAWDVGFWSERLRQERFAVSDEELRPYFPLERVLDGLFRITGRLFGVTVRERPAPAVWHPDVRYFEIHEGEIPEGGTPGAGSLRGSFYLDPFARASKRGGAWMDECLGRASLGAECAAPVAYLVCNFTPPDEAGRALLSHEEVLTLFHEFGHGLHHMLTRVDYPSIAGLNGVAWDAVELPSQFMENFAWEGEGLALISAHHETGEPLPEELFERLRHTRSFQAGMMMLRQIEFSLFDFRLHREYDPARGARVMELLEDVRRRVAVVPYPAHDRFAHGFSHIFGGGYAAGYYSYKWAEVLSADAYSAFEEAGFCDGSTGRRFLQEVLEVGGTRDAMDMFVAFRGREPDVEALMRHSGLAA